jgi:hypothetical protein
MVNVDFRWVVVERDRRSILNFGWARFAVLRRGWVNSEKDSVVANFALSYPGVGCEKEIRARGGGF